MTAGIFIGAIIVTIIIMFLLDRDKMQKEQVGNHGGMKVKYQVMINWFNRNEYTVSKIGKDYILIVCNTPVTTSQFQILENFGGVDITWNANLGVIGTFSKKWSFKNGTNQQHMIDVINEYLEDLHNRI